MKKPALNIIPLIDVLLVIIIIALSAQSFIKYKSIDINPAQSSQGEQVEQKSSELVISAKGEYFLNGSNLTLDELAQRLDSAKRLDIICDKAASFQDFIDVILALKKLNFNEYSIILEQK